MNVPIKILKYGRNVETLVELRHGRMEKRRKVVI